VVTGTVSASAGEALAVLQAGVDGLLDADLSGLSGVEVAELLSALEVQRRRLDAVDVAVVAEAADRGLAGEYAQTGAPELLMMLLRIDPREARRRVEVAQVLGPRRTVTGELLDPILASSADALAAGQVSGLHVGVIAQCLSEVERVPELAVHEVFPVVERFLLDAAQHEHPRALARTAQLVVSRLDPDGAEPAEERAQRQREFSLHPNPDGTSTARGRLSREATAVWEAVFDSLARPVPVSEDVVPDDRTPGQRRHDALLDAGLRLLRSGSLPDCGGAPVTILLTTSREDFEKGDGLARTGHGDVWPMSSVWRYLDCAEVITVVDDPLDGVIAFGRTQRLASPGQRRALAARDGGCCFPGCTRPAAWTEAHHIIAWLDGGLTDLDNSVCSAVFIIGSSRNADGGSRCPTATRSGSRPAGSIRTRNHEETPPTISPTSTDRSASRRHDHRCTPKQSTNPDGDRSWDVDSPSAAWAECGHAR
jgi:hypothetical protein